MRTRAQLIVDGVIKPTVKQPEKVQANALAIISRRSESPRVCRAMGILRAASERFIDGDFPVGKFESGTRSSSHSSS